MNYARKHDSFRSPLPVCGRTIPMTSPLRRKRRTIRRSFRARSEEARGARREARGVERDCGLPAAAGKLLADCGLGRVLIAVAFVAVTSSFASASELKWRSGRSETAEA